MQYQTRTEEDARSQKELERELPGRWAEVDSLRIVQTLLSRDLIKLRRAADEVPTMSADAREHEVALALISVKLEVANIAYQECKDALRQCQKYGQTSPPHGHGHGHSH